jgi:hypothetical protein
MTTTVYKALRLALGKSYGVGTDIDLAIGPREGLRDLWTKCEARVVAAALSKWEHAIWQAFPHTATSFLRLWEDMLLVSPVGSVYERQEAVAQKYTRRVDATVPGLRRSLQEIDERFDVELVPYDLTFATVHGKAFGPLPGVTAAPYGTGLWADRESTAFPNFSDIFIVRVRFLGPLTDTLKAKAVDLLDDVLPAWVDFEIYTLSDGPSGEGFYLDGGPNNDSFLDVTAIT